MAEYKIEVKHDKSMPEFWEVCVYQAGVVAPVFREYGESKAAAQAKGEAYVKSKTAGRGKQIINGDDGNTYATIDEVLRAYNECKISYRQAEVELQKVDGSLSNNDLQDILVNDNPTPPNCNGGNGGNGGDGSSDGTSESEESGPFGLYAYDWWPLSDRHRFMLIGVVTIWLLYRYGRD